MEISNLNLSLNSGHLSLLYYSFSPLDGEALFVIKMNALLCEGRVTIYFPEEKEGEVSSFAGDAQSFHIGAVERIPGR